jgi:hypothetical protein
MKSIRLNQASIMSWTSEMSIGIKQTAQCIIPQDKQAPSQSCLVWNTQLLCSQQVAECYLGGRQGLRRLTDTANTLESL